MKIKEIRINQFRRFTDLTIKDIPESAKLVILVGPNGSGKTSLFEAFYHWYKWHGYRATGDRDYYVKKGEELESEQRWFEKQVFIEAHNHDLKTEQQSSIQGDFYFRTAHRNEPDFMTQSLSRQEDPKKEIRLNSLMETDSCVSQNYQRLVAQTIASVYDTNNDEKSVVQLREELIGKVKKSLNSVFEDLTLTDIGDPLQNGSFYFTKGTSQGFHYKNLSAGEKSAFDMILDLIIKLHAYEDSVYCIDEPEAHMHTALQSRLLEEVYNLVPTKGQLWIATHSMGMLKKAKELEAKNPNSVVFLDFSDRDFDSSVVMTPSTVDSTLWRKFLDLSFGDLANLIAPETVVFCEGGLEKGKRQNFDATIYRTIFTNNHPLAEFVSIGSCSDVEDPNNTSMRIVNALLSHSQIIKLVDRDDKSDKEVADCNAKGIKVLSRRHIESYLFDDEIIRKLCLEKGKEEMVDDCLLAKQEAIKNSIARKNAVDDIKSASGEIMTAIKMKLGLTRCGNDTVSFLRDTMAPLITSDTAVYKELEKIIFE